MEEIIVLIGAGLGLITALCITRGFDLRTRNGWLVILCGFMSGFFLGLSPGGLTSGIGTGMILAVLTMITGPAMNRIHRNRSNFKD